MDICLRVLKESNKSRLDSYSVGDNEAYPQITRYEMTQSSCKRDTKSKNNPDIEIAPVRVFSKCLIILVKRLSR